MYLAFTAFYNPARPTPPQWAFFRAFADAQECGDWWVRSGATRHPNVALATCFIPSTGPWRLIRTTVPRA